MLVQNLIEDFSRSLFTFLTGKTINVKGLLVKKHVDNLETHGDFSFPSCSKSWVEYVDESQRQGISTDLTLLQLIGKTHEDIVEESKLWSLQVKHVLEKNGRVCIFLIRPTSISLGLAEGLVNNEFITQRLQGNCSAVNFDPICEVSASITSFRLICLNKVIENLCLIRFNHEENIPCVGHEVHFYTAANAETSRDEIKAVDFIRSHQNEATKKVQHKYGHRVTTDNKWNEFIDNLGESAAAFELIQLKPTTVGKICCDQMMGRKSKGAPFILYNCARLETMMRTYADQVRAGAYPPLPTFSEVDFTLLTEEEEWNLIYNYVLGFPSLLQSCFEQNKTQDKWEFRPHFLCSFLCSMVKTFSQYYRKTKILVEPRRHLLPIIFARMHMLNVLNQILKTSLKILNIRSIPHM